jgi:hypothetical protein
MQESYFHYYLAAQTPILTLEKRKIAKTAHWWGYASQHGRGDLGGPERGPREKPYVTQGYVGL